MRASLGSVCEYPSEAFGIGLTQNGLSRAVTVPSQLIELRIGVQFGDVPDAAANFLHHSTIVTGANVSRSLRRTRIRTAA